MLKRKGSLFLFNLCFKLWIQISKLLEEKRCFEYLEFKDNCSKTCVITHNLSILLFMRLFQLLGEKLPALIYWENCIKNEITKPWIFSSVASLMNAL